MNDMTNSRPTIKVNQRFGYFYVVKFTARELLDISYPDPLRKENEILKGHQRLIQEDRRKEISKYIESVDCAFPNSIILAANFPPENEGQVESEDSRRWKVRKEKEGNFLEIPDMTKKMAVIIDGQHRVLAFKGASSDKLDMELVCSVYLDLPSSLQAFLFATINSTQKPVPKNIAYELFGFDLAAESPETWSPDKLAISLCRKLNKEQSSPFYNHIISGAIMIEDEEDRDNPPQSWQVSTACMVDCILRLISSKPKDDKYLLYKDGLQRFKQRSRLLLKNQRRDQSPLRELYIQSNDGVIYNIIVNFFAAAHYVFASSFEKPTAICKTIGIQGLFDTLKFYIANENKNDDLRDVDFTESAFIPFLEHSKSIDFSEEIFMKFSGVGRGRIRDAILFRAGLKDISKISNIDFREWLERNG